MQNHLFKLVIALTTLVALTNAQGTKNENFPLSETSVTHCDTIIDGSKIEGDCCALNVTAGNGCVVNVEGGRCKITGQWWSLDFTSTGPGDCPAGFYTAEQLGPFYTPQTVDTLDDGMPDLDSAASALSLLLFSFLVGSVLAVAL